MSDRTRSDHGLKRRDTTSCPAKPKSVTGSHDARSLAGIRTHARQTRHSEEENRLYRLRPAVSRFYRTLDWRSLAAGAEPSLHELGRASYDVPGQAGSACPRCCAAWARFLSYCLHDGPGAIALRALSRFRRTRGLERRMEAMALQYLSQGFLLTQQWWHKAATDCAGVSKHMRHHGVLGSSGARYRLAEEFSLTQSELSRRRESIAA